MDLLLLVCELRQLTISKKFLPMDGKLLCKQSFKDSTCWLAFRLAHPLEVGKWKFMDIDGFINGQEI